MASSYQSFADIGDDSSVLIHVLPENKGGPRLWQQYIHDLDFFFTKIYRYYQKSGFKCLVIGRVLELCQFAFVVLFTVFLYNFVNYPVLFKDKPPLNLSLDSKVTISDVIRKPCDVQIGGLETFLLVAAFLFLFIKTIKMIHSVYVYYAIKLFYQEALHITDCSQFSWQEIQTRIIQAQHQCSLQEGQLNELYIYNRILRQKNYMIALLNKNLLPIHFKVPFLGEYTYLPKGLEYCIELLLFKGPFAIFENSWKLKDEYKSYVKRQMCASRFAKNCLLLAIFNVILSPLILIWQILYLFYAYAETLKRDPSYIFASKNWSIYASLFCRHFNELDHQLNDRLNKGYRPAAKYMNSFTSPLMEVIAQNLMFVAGAILAVLILLTVYDEDVISVEHIITIMAGLGVVIAAARGFISSDVPMKYTKAELNSHILQHIHYSPHRYSPYSLQAHSAMSKIFQYKVQAIIEGLLSPLITPYILFVHLRPKSLEYIDFFRNFTVEIAGTGDVCVFAMMNIKANGNPTWRPEESVQKDKKIDIQPATEEQAFQPTPSVTTVPQNLVTENGKLELSLIHFKLTNPGWEPQESQKYFIDYITSKSLIREYEEEWSIEEETQSSVPFNLNASMLSESGLNRSFAKYIDDKYMNNADLTISLSTRYLYNHSAKVDKSLRESYRSEKDPLISHYAGHSSHSRMD